jgi:DNA polymerase-1
MSPHRQNAAMNNAPPQTLLLVDGSSYLYRAFHAMPDLRAVPGDPSSAPTGAIRGMINMLQSLRKEVPAEFAACVFDAKGPTFRDDLYPDYKAHRSPMPDDLRAQIEPIHEVVRLMGWRVLDVPGVEADDVIGTLAAAAAAQGIRVIVSSGDKDLAQLVNEHITIIDTMNGKRRDVAGVTAEFGVPPGLMIDYQTLVGDAIDNVPGVPKVGPKTAAKWLAEYGSLDAIVAHADAIKGAVGENLRKSLEWLPMGRKLLTIKTDCDLAGWVPELPAMNSIAVGAMNTSALAIFYEQYGFKGLARSLAASAGGANPQAEGATASATSPAVKNAQREPDLFDEPDATEVHTPLASPISAVRYNTILTWEAFDGWMARILTAELVAVDTETTSLDEMRAQIVGLSFSVTPGEAAYIPLAHAYPDAPAQLPLAQVLARLKPWLEDPSRHKLGQHIKYDRHVFANHAIEVQGYAHDTMLQSYVLEVHKTAWAGQPG